MEYLSEEKQRQGKMRGEKDTKRMGGKIEMRGEERGDNKKRRRREKKEMREGGTEEKL